MSELIPYRPNTFRSVFGLGREFERSLEGLFDKAWRGMDAPTEAWIPPIDIRQTDETVEVWVDLPGMSKDAVDIRIEGNVLTISGERMGVIAENENASYRRERPFGNFERSLSLPVELDHTKADATFRDGVLHVTIPRVEQAKPRRLQIKAG
jgi:HSP20 family protein